MAGGITTQLPQRLDSRTTQSYGLQYAQSRSKPQPKPQPNPKLKLSKVATIVADTVFDRLSDGAATIPASTLKSFLLQRGESLERVARIAARIDANQHALAKVNGRAAGDVEVIRRS